MKLYDKYNNIIERKDNIKYERSKTEKGGEKSILCSVRKNEKDNLVCQ
jgi:hypothetical protein